jgi:hypothetical protein
MSPHEFFLQSAKNYRQPKSSSTWTGLVFHRGGFFCVGFPQPLMVALIDGLLFHHTLADDKDSHRVQPEVCSTRLARS